MQPKFRGKGGLSCCHLPLPQSQRMTPTAHDCHPPSPLTPEQCRARLIDAAINAYEQAGLSGLCHEGRWECALAALRLTPLPGPADPH
jgi:hypothetical protein